MRALFPLAFAFFAAGVAADPAAAPPAALKPFAFLAGHCWRGELAQGRGHDEHCFAWILDGHALRDTHVVKAPGRADAQGESIYYLNSASGQVEYLYVESAGGFSRGRVEAQADALAFPETQYIEDGETLVYRARWTLQGPRAYEAFSEARTPEGWRTMFRVRMQRVD